MERLDNQTSPDDRKSTDALRSSILDFDYAEGGGAKNGIGTPGTEGIGGSVTLGAAGIGGRATAGTVGTVGTGGFGTAGMPGTAAGGAAAGVVLARWRAARLVLLLASMSAMTSAVAKTTEEDAMGAPGVLTGC